MTPEIALAADATMAVVQNQGMGRQASLEVRSGLQADAVKSESKHRKSSCDKQSSSPTHAPVWPRLAAAVSTTPPT
jgi:hypothetical protein